MEMKLNSAPRSIWRNPKQFIAFGFGVGAIPIMPGTFGTLLAIPLFFLLQGLPFWLMLTIGLAYLAASIWLCEVCSAEIGVHDHGGMVIDETAPFLLLLMFIPSHWIWITSAFVIFRILDIWKPGPIGFVDKNVSGGWGMVLDDLLGVFFTWIIVQALIWLLPL
jgi:phosphatidylglycerophosphatase A